MIKAVAFDLGKVLLDFDYRIVVDRIAARGRLPAAEIARLINQAPLLLKYETGLLTNDQFFAEVCAATGYCGTADEFAVCFGDMFLPIEPMIQLKQTLKRGGLRTYIFSNTNDLAVRHIRNAFPFFNEFDDYILSYQHGCMKPDPELYKVVERVSGCRGPEILYFDDRPENVAAGAARGWHAIVHESPEKSLLAVRELSLLQAS